MGCGKSKIKRISLTPDDLNKSDLNNGIDTVSGKLNVEITRPKSSGIDFGRNGGIPGETGSEEEENETADRTIPRTEWRPDQVAVADGAKRQRQEEEDANKRESGNTGGSSTSKQ